MTRFELLAEPGLLCCGQLVPLFQPGADGDGAVGLGEAVDVEGAEVVLPQLAQQGGGRRRSGDSCGDGSFQTPRSGAVEEHDMDRGRTVVVGDVLGLE